MPPRSPHHPNPLCALEAEAVALRHRRNLALAALAEHPAPASPAYMVQACALPFGYAQRGQLTITAIEPLALIRLREGEMIFHYEHLGLPVTRATALGLLKQHLARTAPAEAESARA